MQIHCTVSSLTPTNAQVSKKTPPDSVALIIPLSKRRAPSQRYTPPAICTSAFRGEEHTLYVDHCEPRETRCRLCGLRIFKARRHSGLS